MGILDSWLELLGLSGGSMWCERKSVYVRGVSGWWIDANTSCHLQLYFFVSVFLVGAGCVPGLVFVLRDEVAQPASFVCKNVTLVSDCSQPF
jgi:hypothetical protein